MKLKSLTPKIQNLNRSKSNQMDTRTSSLAAAMYDLLILSRDPKKTNYHDKTIQKVSERKLTYNKWLTHAKAIILEKYLFNQDWLL